MAIEDRDLSGDEILYWQNLLQERKKSFLEARDFLKKHALKNLSIAESSEISRVRLPSEGLATQAPDERTLELLLEKNLKVTRDVDDALDRLEQGAFGICQSCGDMIARSRLEAIPETRYCLSCQMDAEEMKSAYQDRNTKATPAFRETSGEIFEKSGTILVSDVMHNHPVTVRMDQGADVASQLMFDYDIKHLPVVDSYGAVQGIISDRDLLSMVLPISWTSVEDVIDFWRHKAISTIMTQTPKTASPDMTLREAGIILLNNKISCLPVVKGNRLVGIVTDTDFVKLLCR